MIFLGLIVIGMRAAHESDNSNHASSTTAAAPEATHQARQEPPIELTADALFAAYKANEVAADEKYKGKLLKVSGVVKSIGKDVMDEPYIALRASDNEFETVNAYFTKSDIENLAKLSKGQDVTVTCRGDGYHVMSPILDCKRG